ncbi:DUF2231 domain-containing protein [Streptomyces griseoviridis]
MGPVLVNGLPAHVLLVHFVVVLVPLTALALLACAVWPSVARRFGIALPVLALVTLISVPITTHAGEWLERHVASDALVRRHTGLGDELLPWVIALFVMSVVVWWVYRRTARAASGEAEYRAVTVALPLRLAVLVLSLAAAVGACVQVYRIGDSGARAAWHDAYSATARTDGVRFR